MNGKSIYNKEYFEWYYNRLYGNCYKFNTAASTTTDNGPWLVKKEGDGLYLEIFTGRDDLYKDFLYEPAYKGIVIYIEDEDTFPIKKEGIFLKVIYYYLLVIFKYFCLRIY